MSVLPPPPTVASVSVTPSASPTVSASPSRPAAGGKTVDLAFAPTSFWYASLRGAPLAANSEAIAANVAEQAGRKGLRPTINTADFSAPIYVVDSSTPRQDVAFNNCQNKSHDEPGFRAQMHNVPIPAHALPAGGTDKEVIFYSPSQDTLGELWVAEKNDGKWSACWGGKLTEVSKGRGAFPHPYGVTAAGLSMYGGTIRVAELQAGRIDHAIGISLPDTASWPNISWPANRTDGWNPDKNPNVPVQGQRLRLDPSVDVDALKIHPVAKTIAKAAQKHGFIVWDTAGVVSLRAENPLAYTSAGKATPIRSCSTARRRTKCSTASRGTGCRRCRSITASPDLRGPCRPRGSLSSLCSVWAVPRSGQQRQVAQQDGLMADT